MLRRNDTLESDLHLAEVSPNSDRDSDNSRDINLNSKTFVDCNLVGTDKKLKNYENDVNNKTDEKVNSVRKPNGGHIETEQTEMCTKNEELSLDKDDIVGPENSENLPNGRKNSVVVTNCSTPKPESAESQALCASFSVGSDSSLEPENGTQTYLIATSTLSQSNALTNEEIGKKFQDLSFAFRTDAMTIPKRLYLMKRRRDQAETNIENELTIIKSKLKTLQYLGLNSEYVHLITDLKKQLDFVLNAVIQLSSSAESYGYIQHEENLLEFITIMLQHVENIETSKSNAFKMSEKLKAENQRSQSPISLDMEGTEGRILRRGSVAALTVESNSRRRASIATLPRMGYSSSDNGYNVKGFQWTPTRPAGNVAKKLSFSQASSRANTNNISGIEDSRRDTNGARHRKESRNNEGSMGNIEEFPERPLTVDPELLQELPAMDDNSIDTNDSSLQLKQLFESVEEIRRNSNSQEHITAIYCFKRIIEWSRLLLNSSRFRWPETSLQYVPFYITWYVVFVLILVFMGGLFTGINGCYICSCVKYSALWFVVPPLFCFIRRYYRLLLLLLFTSLLALIFAFLWLTEILIPQLSKEEIDSLFKVIGLEIRYLYGPPPV